MGFRDRDSLVTDRGRKLREGPVYSYLGKHLRDVRIFFDWRCNGALNRKRIRAHIVRGDDDFRRGDFRKLCNGKSPGHDDSRNHDQNGDYNGGDRPINKEFRH